MGFKCECPNCKQHFACEDDMEGMKIQCPICNLKFILHNDHFQKQVYEKEQQEQKRLKRLKEDRSIVFSSL